MNTEQKAKDNVLAMMKRLVPGTISIGNCDAVEYCMSNSMRSCDDIKNLCVSCRDNDRIIGGISFLYGGTIGGKSGKNGIVLYRYSQEGSYANMFEGDGINDIMEKIEKDETINDIAEKTKFIRDENKEAEDLKTIEAFKRYIDQSDNDDICILVTRKNSSGEYEDLDKKLIEIAEKEKRSGNKIKIVDGSEIDRKTYVLGINSKELAKKLELEANAINDADNRVHVFVFPAYGSKGKNKYAGILAISSIEDDVLNVNDNKDTWKKHFTEKYKGLTFISTETFRK